MYSSFACCTHLLLNIFLENCLRFTRANISTRGMRTNQQRGTNNDILHCCRLLLCLKRNLYDRIDDAGSSNYFQSSVGNLGFTYHGQETVFFLTTDAFTCAGSHDSNPDCDHDFADFCQPAPELVCLQAIYTQHTRTAIRSWGAPQFFAMHTTRTDNPSLAANQPRILF